MWLRSLRLLVALLALLFAAPGLAADASTAQLDAQNANLVEQGPFDLDAHLRKWERREAKYKAIGWVGAAFALAGDAALVGAYFTGAPFFWAFGVPAAGLGTALILPGAIIPAYGLVELGAAGRGPTLGYVAVGLASVATMCGFIALAFYSGDMYSGYLSDGTVVFTTGMMLVLFASHGFALRQMVVDARVRRTLPEPAASAPRPRLRIAVTPRIDRAPGVALVGTF